jgi:hypothetical protein
MAKGFTKEPIPYVSNKTYLWRFLQGFFCGAIFGLGIDNLGYGLGAGIGRFFEMLIPGIVLGLVLGYGVYYVWKDHTAKSESKNLESL